MYTGVKLCSFKSLPVLEVTKETFFSSTEGSRFLFPPFARKKDQIDLWLEWDSRKLQVLS